MPRSKSKGSYVGRRAVMQSRSRRRVSKTVDFLAVSSEHSATQAGEKAVKETSSLSLWQTLRLSCRKAIIQLKKSLRFMRRELLDDPEGYFARVGHSIGYGLLAFFRGFASFSRYLLLPLSIIITIGSLITMSAYAVGLEVRLNGEVIGYVADASTFDTARVAVEERYSQQLG